MTKKKMKDLIAYVPDKYKFLFILLGSLGSFGTFYFERIVDPMNETATKVNEITLQTNNNTNDINHLEEALVEHKASQAVEAARLREDISGLGNTIETMRTEQRTDINRVMDKLIELTD